MNKRYFLKGVLSALGIVITGKVKAISSNIENNISDAIDKVNKNDQMSTPTATRTPSISTTPSRTRTPSLTPSNTPSMTPSQTRSVSISVSPSGTNSVSNSISSSPTPTRSPSTSTSPSTTPSYTSSPSRTPSISVTNTPSISESPSNSIISSSTPSISSTPSQTPSETPSTTPSITPSASSVLPVELLYFELINSINESVLISFATTSETNNNGFNIFKSTNFSSFKHLTTIKGKINSYQLETYSFEDKNVQNGEFITYQLIQNDTNGFSKIIATESIEVLKSDIFLSEIFPNPTYRNGYVKINTSKPITLELQIQNTLGFTIHKFQYKFNSGNHQLELPIQSISKGLYILSFILNEKTIVRKLVLN